MRAADAATYFRTALAVLTIYLVIARVNPILIAVLIAVTMLLDAVDGYLAVWEISGGRVSLGQYMKASMGDQRLLKAIKQYKHKAADSARYGPRIDVAGDRVVEYVFWIVYTYVGLLPLWVLLIVVIRHSFVDAFMAAKGTSSKMRTAFARAVYSSNVGRSGINVVKFLAFAYLAFAYVWGWPIIVGYILVAILLVYILLRGAAEIYEATRE